MVSTANHSTALPASDFGFPPGFFIIRSVANNRLLDVTEDRVKDGTEIILYAEKDKSLVHGFRSVEADNQVFFIDPTGALCSKSSGHALDVQGGHLVLRHRRPLYAPFPNSYSHSLPKFWYINGEISLTFEHDPTYGSSGSSWRDKAYILAAIPRKAPQTFLNNASAFFSSALATPISLLTNAPPQPTAEEVLSSELDLKEDEVLETDRGEENEVDDSADADRFVRLLALTRKTEDDPSLAELARARRQWEVVPLRSTNKKTST